ncbi:MAG: inorganic phosphate transporter [Candidatus Gracilibacteria bacterium]|nr:inorganic phosphate transporter [Candidatus Gracilibacteria bacterium]
MDIFILILCLGIVLSFEFINGMNDTANAIAPVIYSHSLEAKKSVFLAAVLNFLGVLLGGTTVAMSILHLLPLGIITEQPTNFGILLVLSILIAAIIWDLGAWYLALPVSSSHALIGSILGVSIAIMYSAAGSEFTPHWGKAEEVVVGLLISPIIGFGCALILIYIAHRFIKREEYFRAPMNAGDRPSLAIRSTLILASGLVSFMHGKNDGQKGVGIATLILITLIPSAFAINPKLDMNTLSENVHAISTQVAQIDTNKLPTREAELTGNIKIATNELQTLIAKAGNGEIDRAGIRKNIFKIRDNYTSLNTLETNNLVPSASANSVHISLANINENINNLLGATDYVPWWIIVLVSIAIGSGTMIGWKRIVETIGEKIGKYKMNYSQAASSAFITAGTIGAASTLGLPVSTTHVMSSSVAGTMVEEHGWKNGIDPHMVKHILLAWILTMPSTILIAGTLFLGLQWFFL